jgi:hypothetical protein
MGWASGSYLAQDIYDNIRDLIPEENRMKVADTIYSQFSDEDADDWDSESDLLKDAKISFEDED